MIQNTKTSLSPSDRLKDAVAEVTLADEDHLLATLKRQLSLDKQSWSEIAAESGELIERIRGQKSTPLIDQFLTEYGLSSDEGVQLMRLAEALSRTTDTITANELIADKIMNRDWRSHAGAGHSIPMRAAGAGLHISDQWLRWSSDQKNGLTKSIAKMGNNVLRSSVRTGIRALSSQFVFAETLAGGMKRADEYSKSGYLFSFDMLGEAARTKDDAAKYYTSYSEALDVVIGHARFDDPQRNNGISIKLSALHPRYEYGHAKEVVPELTALLLPLIQRARAANVQITIDAEEAERLDISMIVLAALVAMPELKGWHGLGFVVQAYQRRALPLLDWLRSKSDELGAPLMIRLVKGAYWDSEIKRAQELGLESYPVFTRKETTDISYLACAKKLLAHPDQFSPQFATHNAHTVTAVQMIAGPDRPLEFQRLFGMGQQLHDIILEQPKIVSRIYAPVGTQKDLLSYLIRRLLENGANSSFVHKLADQSIPVSELSNDPVSILQSNISVRNDDIGEPRDYLGDGRRIAMGVDFSNPLARKGFVQAIKNAAQGRYHSEPIIAGKRVKGEPLPITNPANHSETVGHCSDGNVDSVDRAIAAATNAFTYWSARPRADRAIMMENAGNLLEQRASVFHYLAIKEAGKTWSDAVDEVREAVDFCRYYAAEIRKDKFEGRQPLGVVACISPWNFPLAIFLGQIVAALAAGNTVVAKPAEQTPLIAAEAIRLLHDAGVDPAAVNFVPGSGAIVGAALASDPRVTGICFTGSTTTAKKISHTLIDSGRPLTPFIAETGGINAMIVDSSALLEQTVDAIISSAFQSAGQRCSALRVVCLQDDIADDCISLLGGAMAALKVGDPVEISTDVGPVIDEQAQKKIRDHIISMDDNATRVSKRSDQDLDQGYFVHPVAFELEKLEDLNEEIFGPVLHIIRFSADSKMEMIDAINDSGYGLTLGIQSRIDTLCKTLSTLANTGNIYINRNQIGAVVGAQPFGGHGLSGTGPKAGGPLYLYRLSQSKMAQQVRFTSNIDNPVLRPDTSEVALHNAVAVGRAAFQHIRSNIFDLARSEKWRSIGPDWTEAFLSKQRKQLDEIFPQSKGLPATAGETNEYCVSGRGLIVSFNQSADEAIAGCLKSIITGNVFLQINQNETLEQLEEIAQHIEKLYQQEGLVQQVSCNDIVDAIRRIPVSEIDALMVCRQGELPTKVASQAVKITEPIMPILTPQDSLDRFVHEKTITHNIAAAGGDVSLLNK